MKRKERKVKLSYSLKQVYNVVDYFSGKIIAANINNFFDAVNYADLYELETGFTAIIESEYK